MTDDKAIEAALDVWTEYEWRGEDDESDMRRDMRAALAAADKVRAERSAEPPVDGDDNDAVILPGEEYRRLLAGLAKGEADRAALVEALEPFARFGDMLAAKPLGGRGGYSIHIGTEWEATIRPSDLSRVRAALALVRKGV